jgi:hypothetical protein
MLSDSRHDHGSQPESGRNQARIFELKAEAQLTTPVFALFCEDY